MISLKISFIMENSDKYENALDVISQMWDLNEDAELAPIIPIISTQVFTDFIKHLKNKNNLIWVPLLAAQPNIADSRPVNLLQKN